MEAAGVEVAKNGKIPCVNEQTNVPNIYAVGDIVHGKLELTPVAIQASKLLIDRLYRGSTIGMDYELVPTTVFTPMEYGACGLAEEAAIERYGQDAVEIYHATFTPLEWSLTSGKDKEKGYVKVRSLRERGCGCGCGCGCGICRVSKRLAAHTSPCACVPACVQP